MGWAYFVLPPQPANLPLFQVRITLLYLQGLYLSHLFPDTPNTADLSVESRSVRRPEKELLASVAVIFLLYAFVPEHMQAAHWARVSSSPYPCSIFQ